MFRDQHNVRVLRGEVTGVDAAAGAVILRNGARIGYDYRVLATGARHSHFGRDGREPYAPGLTWWLWGGAHVCFLVDPRKRLSVATEWFWAYSDPV